MTRRSLTLKDTFRFQGLEKWQGELPPHRNSGSLGEARPTQYFQGSELS